MLVSKRFIEFIFNWSLVVGFGLSSVCCGQSTYWVTDLGTLGGPTSVANGINETRQITGYSFSSSPSTLLGFLHVNNQMNSIGNPAGFLRSIGSAINDDGAIAVTAYSGSTLDSARAFVYQNGGYTSLGTLGGAESTTSINNAGVVVGASLNGSQVRGFRYDSVNGMVNLSGLLSSSVSVANDIDNSGRIVGWRMVGNSRQGYVLDGGVVANIAGSHSAISISDNGLVTGFSTANGIRAFAYDYGSSSPSYLELGTLGGTESYGYDANSSGQIVGYSYVAGDTQYHAFLYEDGVMYDLNGLVANGAGWTLNRALGLNDSGDIVGFGVFNGEERAFMLSAVPEPSTISVLFLAAMGCCMSRSRSKISSKF